MNRSKHLALPERDSQVTRTLCVYFFLDAEGLNLTPDRQTGQLVKYILFCPLTERLLSFWWLPLSPHPLSLSLMTQGQRNQRDVSGDPSAMTDHTPSQLSSGELNIGQINESVYLFPSAKKGGGVFRSVNILLGIILQWKQNQKQYLRVYELTIISESKQPGPPVGLRKKKY